MIRFTLVSYLDSSLCKLGVRSVHITLLSESKDGLQKSLEKLEKYTEEWDMNVNKKKTKIMIIQNTGKIPAGDFTYEGQNLEVVECYKYLGTMISRTGSFKLNHAYLKNKGLKARYAITRNIGLDCKASTIMKLFQKMVEPILLYNCEVAQACIPNSWNEEKFKIKMWEDREIDKVTKGLIRQILGISKKTTNMGIRAELGKYPLSLNIYTQMIKYWTRLLSSESILLQESHLDNLERLKTKKTSWIRTIMFILGACGVKEIDVDEICKNEHTFHKDIQKKLTDSYKKHWEKEAETMKDGKMAFFLKLKKSFKFETYLDNIPRSKRRAITKLRLSCHTLPVEVMRYQKIERTERKCTICTNDEVGDEMHYLTSCDHEEMRNSREIFIQKAKSIQPQLKTFDKANLMTYSLSMNDESIQVETADFITEMLKIYSNTKDMERNTCAIM